MTLANVTYRTKVLEKGFKSLDGKVDKIMTNELPHINGAIIKLHGRIDSLCTKISVLSIINVGAIVIGLLVNKFL